MRAIHCKENSVTLMQLDFHDTRRRGRRLGIFFLVTGIVAVCWTIPRFFLLDQENLRIESMAADAEALARRLNSIDAKQKAAQQKSLAHRSGTHNRFVNGRLFQALEAAWQPNIALLRTDWHLSEGKLALELQAKSLEDGMRFIDALKKQPVFSSITLLRHATLREDAGVNGAAALFALEASWESLHASATPVSAESAAPDWKRGRE
jgi:hypothetical protein